MKILDRMLLFCMWLSLRVNIYSTFTDNIIDNKHKKK